MGVTKSEMFTASQNHLALLAKAIGHPARIAILECLIKSQKCIGSVIVDEVPLAQPTISQHLKELKMAGLIQGNVEGTSICYCINPKAFETLRLFLQICSDSPDFSTDCCTI